MNMDELKEAWEDLNRAGVKSKTENEIQEIISYGTAEVVSGINKKLFMGMAITAFASVASALGVVFFYLVFDPEKHAWIDLSKLIPIQLLGFAIFLVLFLFGWLEFKVVNRKFTSKSVKADISALVSNLKSNSRIFMLVVLTLLAVTFYVEFNYFFPAHLLIKSAGSIVLTGASFIGIKIYFRKSFGSYLEDLGSYQKELDS